MERLLGQGRRSFNTLGKFIETNRRATPVVSIIVDQQGWFYVVDQSRQFPIRQTPVKWRIDEAEASAGEMNDDQFGSVAGISRKPVTFRETKTRQNGCAAAD